jgi:hypothetical protein
VTENLQRQGPENVALFLRSVTYQFALLWFAVGYLPVPLHQPNSNSQANTAHWDRADPVTYLLAFSPYPQEISENPCAIAHKFEFPDHRNPCIADDFRLCIAEPCCAN